KTFHFAEDLIRGISDAHNRRDALTQFLAGARRLRDESGELRTRLVDERAASFVRRSRGGNEDRIVDEHHRDPSAESAPERHGPAKRQPRLGREIDRTQNGSKCHAPMVIRRGTRFALYGSAGALMAGIPAPVLRIRKGASGTRT